MKETIGPIPRQKIILCSADGGPRSQRNNPRSAGYFFPGAKWVGAVRNSAERLKCKFVILTTGHGLVEQGDTIQPYDKHIDQFRDEVTSKWRSTIPKILSEYKNGLMLCYFGRCPRDAYAEVLMPILDELRISFLTFGRPNMVDVAKIEPCVDLIEKGTSIDEIASLLRLPERLKYHELSEESILLSSRGGYNEKLPQGTLV